MATAAATNAMRSCPRTGNHAWGESSRIAVKATSARNATTFAVPAGACRSSRVAGPLGFAAGRHQAAD
jgi:hypothetical protein